MDLIHDSLEFIEYYMLIYGYWAVFFGVMLENAGLPIPGETILLVQPMQIGCTRHDVVMRIERIGAKPVERVGAKRDHAAFSHDVVRALHRQFVLIRVFLRLGASSTLGSNPVTYGFTIAYDDAK